MNSLGSKRKEIIPDTATYRAKKPLQTGSPQHLHRKDKKAVEAHWHWTDFQEGMRDPCKQKISFPKLSSHHPALTHTHLHWKWGKREAVFKTNFPYASKIG